MQTSLQTGVKLTQRMWKIWQQPFLNRLYKITLGFIDFQHFFEDKTKGNYLYFYSQITTFLRMGVNIDIFTSFPIHFCGLLGKKIPVLK